MEFILYFKSNEPKGYSFHVLFKLFYLNRLLVTTEILEYLEMGLTIFCAIIRSFVAVETLKNFAKSDFGRGRAWHIRFHLPLDEMDTMTDATISFPQGTGTMYKYYVIISAFIFHEKLTPVICPRNFFSFL